MDELKPSRPDVTLLAVGGGGLNIALDLAKSEFLKSYPIIAYDSDSDYFEKISMQEDEIPLYFSAIPENHRAQTPVAELNYYSENLLDWAIRLGGLSKITILCTTLGGKVGTHVAPLIGLATSLQGRFVISVYSLPLKFEGEKRMIRAKEAGEKIIDVSNIAIEQQNDYLGRLSELKVDEIHVPMVKTFKNIYEKPIFLISERCNEYADVEKLVPEEYRKENEELIRVHVNSYLNTSIRTKIRRFRV